MSAVRTAWLIKESPSVASKMSLRPLSPELQEKAKRELNEDPNRIKDDIKYIKEWLDKQPHLKARKEDQWILAFLRGSKFSLERTKERLDMFYTMRTLLPEFFKNRDPLQPQIQEILDMGLFLPLKQPTPEGERIILIRSNGNDALKFSTAEVFKTYGMIIDILVNEDDNFLIAGLQAINDLKGGSANNIAHINPVTIKKFLKCFQEAYPLRPKGLIFLNAPSFFEMVYNLFKAFLSEKLKKRMSVYVDENITNGAIPKAVLPKEYGGDGESVAELTEYWKKKVISYSSWFKEDANYYSIESKRPGKPKTSDIVFGVEGSFRKLEFD